MIRIKVFATNGIFLEYFKEYFSYGAEIEQFKISLSFFVAVTPFFSGAPNCTN